MKVKLEVKTKSIKDNSKAIVEVYQYKNGGNPTLYKKLEDLEIKGNKLVHKDGQVAEFKFEWHKNIWEYKRTQFFYQLKIDSLVKAIEQVEAKMLRLKHYDSVASVTDAVISGVEGVWVDNYLKTKGPFWEATSGAIKQDGHETHYISTNEFKKDDFADLLERNKFIHHQDSHGIAICDDHVFSSPWLEKSTTVGADGVTEYHCPKCKNNTNAIKVFTEHKARYNIPDDAKLDFVEKRYLELPLNLESEEGVEIRDELVWVGQFIKNVSFYELTCDMSGNVIRFEGSS